MTMSSQPTEVLPLGESDLGNVSASDRAYFHLDDLALSAEARKDNFAAYENANRVDAINVPKHGVPTHAKGEQTGLGPTQGPQAYVGKPPPTDLESDIGHAFSSITLISR